MIRCWVQNGIVGVFVCRPFRTQSFVTFYEGLKPLAIISCPFRAAKGESTLGFLQQKTSVEFKEDEKFKES